MKTLRLGAASLLSVLVFAQDAFAAESFAVVAVAGPPGPGPELSELTQQLRLVVAERASGVLSTNELRERMTGQTSSATLGELDRAYAGALARYQNGDFEGSVRTLRAVVEDLERLPPGQEAFNQWTRAVLRLARSEQTLGRGGQARELLVRLVRANPGVKVDLTDYPPSFLKQVEELKAHVAKLPKHTLTVNATAKGAKVFVEGREVGVTPLTLDLPAGRYRVSGLVQSLHVPTVIADLTAEAQSVMLNFALADALRPGSGPGLALPETDRATKIVACGAWLGVDKLLAAQLLNDGGVEYLSATLFDVRRGMLLREGRVRLNARDAPAGSLTALAAFLISGQPSKLVAQTQVVPTPADAVKPAPERKPSLQAKPQESKPAVDVSEPAPVASGKSKMLGWTAVGSGVLGVVLGGFAIYESSVASSKYSKANGLASGGVLNTNASAGEFNSLVSSGDSAKNAAVISGTAAAGCLVVSGALGYLSYKQTGEIGPFRF
jgi:hypothetical protein